MPVTKEYNRYGEELENLLGLQTSPAQELQHRHYGLKASVCGGSQTSSG